MTSTTSLPKMASPQPVRLRLGLGLRLFLAILVVVLLGDGISAELVDRSVQTRAQDEVEERLSYEVTMLGQMTANALFGPIDPTDTSLASVVKQLADAVNTNLTVLAPDGTVVADSGAVDVKAFKNELDAPEVASAIAHGRGIAIRTPQGGGGLRVFVGEAIRRDGHILGIARASVPITLVDAAAHAARVQMAYGAVAAAVIAVVMAGLLALGIVRPIRKLSDGAKQLGGGALAHRVEVEHNDEIGDLAQALNEMAARLESMMGALAQRNRDMRIVLDNVAEGLVTVEPDGTIAAERSLSIDRWFDSPPPGTKLWDLFAGAAPGVKYALEFGWDQLFADMFPRELAIAQLPRRICAGDRIFELCCEPIAKGEQLERCLVVVSDVTDRVAAEQNEVVQKEQLHLFGEVAKDREGVVEYVRTTSDLVELIASHSGERDQVAAVKRALHTIKGNSGLMGLTSLSTLCHDIETRIAENEEGDACSGNLLSPKEMDALADAWSSLAKRVHDLLGHAPSSGLEVTPADVLALAAAIRRGCDRDTLLGMIGVWSLEPVNKRLGRLAEQTRQLASRVGKAGLTVEVSASSVRLPSDRWAPFWSNLSHVLRNAVDHGIEAPEQRATHGKPEHGRLAMSVVEADAQIVVEISDDGRGIDWGSLREKARKEGVPAETQGDLVEALFSDGISTREEVSELSGRGVGLGAVRTACASMGGRIQVMSSLGVGTTFRFSFPVPRPSEVVARVQASA